VPLVPQQQQQRLQKMAPLAVQAPLFQRFHLSQ